jgi:hypothetical protein
MSDLRGIDSRAEKELERFQSIHKIKDLAPVETPFTKNIRRIKATVEGARKELAFTKIDEQARNAFNAKLVEATRADLQELLTVEHQRLEADTARFAKAYQRNIENNQNAYDREVRLKTMRYQAMSEKELVNAAADFRDHPRPELPEAIDALCAALKPVDPIMHAQLRDIISQDKRYEGWRFTDEGRKLTKGLDTFNQAIRIGDHVPLELPDGNYRVESLGEIVGLI